MKILSIVLGASLFLGAGVVRGQTAPGTVQPPASAGVPVSGRLLGHDGRPMLKAMAEILRSENRQPEAAMRVGSDGSFRLLAPGGGFFLLRLSGVYHKAAFIPLILKDGDSVRVEVKLATYKLQSEPGRVGLVGDFNRYAFNNPLPMLKQPDGTWRSQVKAVRDSLAYEVVGVEADGRGIPGTEAAAYTPDGQGDFLAVIPAPDSTFVLTFDPKKLPASDDPMRLKSDRAHPDLEKYTALVAEGKRLFSLFQLNYIYHEQLAEATDNGQKDAGAVLQRGSDSLAAEVSKSGADELLNRARKAKDPLERELLFIIRLRLEGFSPDGAPKSLVEQVDREVPPLSPWWSLDPDLIMQELLTEGRAALPADYIRQASEKHLDPGVRGSAWLCRLNRANLDKKREEALAIFDRLNKEYAGTQATVYAGALFNPQVMIREGEQVPEFSFASLDKPGTRYTNADFKGKTYLIDFWATWCGPCVAEMPKLHSAYDKYRSKGLDILSLSLDKTVDKVTTFRAGQWKMPWKNGFMEGGTDNPMGKAFEISSIPKPVLVDASGKILATGMKLRGRMLEKTLARVFSSSNAAR